MTSYSSLRLAALMSGLLLSACQNMMVPGKPVETVLPASSEVAPDSVERRLSSLEADVADLQTEVTASRPVLAKVKVIDRHFRQLSLELDKINSTYNLEVPAMRPDKTAPDTASVKLVPPPVLKAPSRIKAIPEIKKSNIPAIKAGPLEVRQVRIGEQPGGRTRIVLDATGPFKISHDIDNVEKILIIDIPEVGWSALSAQTLKSSPLIESFRAEKDASGVHLIIQLRKPVKIVSTSTLGPSGGAGHRVFLDLAAN